VAITLALFLLAVFASSDRPISWLVAHMTLDPSTAYFRLYVFDYVMEQIKLKQLVGYGFGPIGDDEFLSTTTVDCVWLVNAARYGIPMIAIFFCANLMTFVSFGPKGRGGRADEFMRRAGTGFTQVIVTFMLVGVTVHFWNATWQLWAVCLGIRGAIKEWNRYQERRVAQDPRLSSGSSKLMSTATQRRPYQIANRFSK
jgi:O-antigen ligase